MSGSKWFRYGINSSPAKCQTVLTQLRQKVLNGIPNFSVFQSPCLYEESLKCSYLTPLVDSPNLKFKKKS